MQAPNWTDFLQCSVCTNRYTTTSLLPISLSCGHTICKKCLTEFMARVCPYDKTAISPNAELLPPNSALMWLLGGEEEEDEKKYFSQLNLSPEGFEHFQSSRRSIRESAVFLQPLTEQSGTSVIHYLTRPMMKKLVTVVNCQFLEPDGRARVLRAARSITDRTITELLVMHQNQQQISTLLWSAIRSRGCQFLGPVMQEEALKLILKVLEGGAYLSRKNIVLYVVQQLQQQDFHQASKTCVGHVVQLLYRASCFNVEKRDEDSSRMRLKEEFRTYEALRREHDAQIIRVAMEGGLRISPEQWSALLYGDQKHKSDMQSIIDKLLSMGIATSGLSELIVAIRRSQDQHNLLEKIVPHLEKLLKVDINIDKGSPLVQQWSFFSESMAALVSMLQEYSSFMKLYMQDTHTGPNPSQIQSGRYKTGLCPNLSKPGGCPKGEKCTYAHTEEERERYRHLARGAKNKSRELGKPLSGPQSIPARTGSGRWSGDIGTKLDSSPYSSLGASFEGISPAFPSGGQAFTSSGSGSGFNVTDGYSEYSSLPHTGVGNPAPIVLQSVVGQPASLTSDPTLPSHVIPPQPQLVAYRNPHHSGPLTVSGEQLTVYDTHMDPAYFTAPGRSGTIQDEYGMGSGVGVASGESRYSATAQPALQQDSYLTAHTPSALDSIKQVHADIKRNIHFTSEDMNHTQYPASDLRCLHSKGEEFYRHDNATSHGTVVPSDPPPIPSSSSGGVFQTDPGRGALGYREGEVEEGERVEDSGERGEGGEGEALASQISQLQLKDPGYYETSPPSSANGGMGGSASGHAPPESHPQYSMSHSSTFPMTAATNLGTETVQPHYSTVDVAGRGGATGGGGEVEAMREKIRLLEGQLAREKMKTSQQISGPPPMQQSPAHTSLVYGNTTDGYSAQVQQYAARVQQVPMYPTVTVQQPTGYYSAPLATPTYQYSDWSGPQQSLHYSGELASLQTVPHVSAGYVLQQQMPTQPTIGRSVYVQQQVAPPLQDVLNKDHMLAMYLQALEQTRVPQYTQHHSLPSPLQQSPRQHSTQVGHGGGASLAYPTANHYAPSSGTQYVMKPYQ